jgi:hypothetical protein
MNVIRTAAVELVSAPAIAYRQKLASGGAGVKLFRLDRDASAFFTIDKRTGEAVALQPVDETIFPKQTLSEALQLTTGLPYSARGKLKITVLEQHNDEEDAPAPPEETAGIAESFEYKALLQRYTTEKGKFNYAMMNRDFIQFAGKSKVVAGMVAEKAAVEDILLFVVKSRTAFYAEKKESLGDKEIAALIATLDEMDPRGALKELSAYVKRLLARK